MALPEDTAALANLGDKEPGYLIRSQDWNALVTSVVTIRDAVAVLQTSIEGISESVAALSTSVGDLDARVSAAEVDLVNLHTNVDPFFRDYYRITLATARTSYALGEQAEITATVTDLAGRPLDFTQRERPWIDLVASWGRLSAVPGFETQSGAGDNSLAVRVDGNGVARVRVLSEHSDGFGNDQEDQVATAMQLSLPNSVQQVSQAFLAAATPADINATSAYKVISSEYERTGSSMRNYLDAYYTVSTPQRALSVLPFPGSTWRDYRATVLAFVRNDSDPTTPDQARAISSIQVTFRDWIYHWVFDYLDDIEPLVTDFRFTLGANVSSDYVASLNRMQANIAESTANAGLVQRQRTFRAWEAAADSFEMSVPPPFIGDLRDNLRGGLQLQQVVDVAEAATGAPAQRAFDAYASTSAKVAGVDSAVGSVRGDVDVLNSSVSEVQTSVSGLQLQVDNTASASTTITATLDQISQKVQGIDLLDQDTLQASLRSIGADIGSIRTTITPQLVGGGG
jgi:hypothetical protein